MFKVNLLLSLLLFFAYSTAQSQQAQIINASGKGNISFTGNEVSASIDFCTSSLFIQFDKIDDYSSDFSYMSDRGTSDSVEFFIDQWTRGTFHIMSSEKDTVAIVSISLNSQRIIGVELSSNNSIIEDTIYISSHTDFKNPKLILTTNSTTSFEECFDGGANLFINDQSSSEFISINGRDLMTENYNLSDGDSIHFSIDRFALTCGCGSENVTEIISKTYHIRELQDQITSLDDTELNSLTTLFPNPSSSIINIKSSEIGTLEIYNKLGQLQFISTNATPINISHLENGVYYYLFRTEATNSTGSIVKN